jgi:hypothetical protein
LPFGLPVAYAGGHAGAAETTSFDPPTTGQVVTWKNRILNVYTKLGDLSSTVSQAQADPSVAAMWSSISTAAVKIKAASNLGGASRHAKM